VRVYFRHCVQQISKIIFSLGRDTSRVPSIKQERHLYWGWSYLHLSFIEYKFIFMINQLVNLIDANKHFIKSHYFFQIVSFNNTSTTNLIVISTLFVLYFTLNLLSYLTLQFQSTTTTLLDQICLDWLLMLDQGRIFFWHKFKDA